MKELRPAVVAALVLVILFTAGCAMFNKTNLAYTRTTTLGAELIDLQAARNKGAITEEEYKTLKDKLMEGEPVGMPNAPM